MEDQYVYAIIVSLIVLWMLYLVTKVAIDKSALTKNAKIQTRLLAEMALNQGIKAERVKKIIELEDDTILLPND